MATDQFILEVTKVMIPVLTGFLLLAVKAISPYWEENERPSKSDYRWVIAIAISGFLSFACWAGALAGAMIFTTKGSGSIIPFLEISHDTAIRHARIYVSSAYSFFVICVFVTGTYYFKLVWRKGFKTPIK